MALRGTFRFLCAARGGPAGVRRHGRRIAGLGVGLDRQRAGCEEREQGKPRDNRFHELAPGSKYRFGVSLELVGLPTGITLALVAAPNRISILPRATRSRLRIIPAPAAALTAVSNCGFSPHFFVPNDPLRRSAAGCTRPGDGPRPESGRASLDRLPPWSPAKNQPPPRTAAVLLRGLARDPVSGARSS